MGAIATGVTLVVVVVSKFSEGAWLAVLVIPATVFTFSRVKRHYADVAAQVADEQPLEHVETVPPIVVVPSIMMRRERID